MYKSLVIAVVILGMAGLSQAITPIFAIDCQSATGMTQPGMEALSFATTTGSVSFTTASGHTITLTPSGVGPATAVNVLHR